MQKIFYLIGGFFFVGLAFLGVVIPGLPTTPFLLVAASLFAKSSPRMYKWLLKNRLFGPLIRNWQETRTIPRRAKWISLVLIVLIATISVISLDKIYLKAIVIVLLLYPLWFIWRIKETENLDS